jgi:surface antigen
MRPMMAWSLIWGTFVVAALITPALPSAAANCALYARAETGVALYGSAGGWWDQADGRYQRGHVPVVGAILVFKRTRHIPSGHVAVVAQVVSAREILVDQANWPRGRVSHSMSVIDTSVDHDWTSVAVIDLSSGKYGRDNPTYGFVYPRSGPHETVEASAGDGVWRGLVHLAAVTEDQWRSIDSQAVREIHRYQAAAGRPVRKVLRAHAPRALSRAKPAPSAHLSRAAPSRTHATSHHTGARINRA